MSVRCTPVWLGVGLLKQGVGGSVAVRRSGGLPQAEGEPALSEAFLVLLTAVLL